MKNLKKTSGVVRLNDIVGVTKKCSEDWKVSAESETLQGSVPSLPGVWDPWPRQLWTFSGSTWASEAWLIHMHSPQTCKAASGMHVKFIGRGTPPTHTALPMTDPSSLRKASSLEGHGVRFPCP